MRYPLYIISKGRYQYRHTAKYLDKINIPYSIVIEPQEYELYAEHIPQSKILVLPFSNLGQGSIPARNWVWQHSLDAGAKKHWILDDNIRAFYTYGDNERIYAEAGWRGFSDIEDFCDGYQNIALGGMQYSMFAPSREKHPAILFNTRVYSCILIDNAIPYRWRGRYNEDTDLSLRALKDGWCTALFYRYLAAKISTMQYKGGNTDELYKDDGRYQMARSLQLQHPDVTKITYKWGRYQHSVDYKPFKNNKLVPVR